MRRSVPATIISFIVGIIQLILVLRFVFQLFNANEGAAFVQLIYGLSQPLLLPFAAIFPNIELNNGFILELSTIIAIIVYGVVGMLLKRLFLVKKEPVQRETVIREEPTHREKTVIKEERR
ncbi:YggT family protein [Fictibacillus nanhaiensis]|uniref:YggT family protein n=1 Tax=Fictibacillus nanhaiensis TaxID=742169 RepID=UPI001C94B5E4|nr:YggT family protein [Fictibacillus nanhaiensis]MBY6038120.1 YggT family protein [Fictibacillus nanhaiensis]